MLGLSVGWGGISRWPCAHASLSSPPSLWTQQPQGECGEVGIYLRLRPSYKKMLTPVSYKAALPGC